MDSRAIRSPNGCWNCRLRRKKCDENHPSCSTCINLKLMCYGYGSRPDWMDGGKLQKEQAERVKQIVKENTRQSRRNLQRNLRRRTLSQDIVTLPGHLPSPPEVPTPPASVSSSSLGAADAARASAVMRESTSCKTSDTDPRGSGLTTMDSYHNDNIVLQDLISDNLDMSVFPLNQSAARISEESWLESLMRPVGRVSESPFDESNSLRGSDSWLEMGHQTSTDADRSILSPANVSSMEESSVDYQATFTPSLDEYSCARGSFNTPDSLTLEHTPKYPSLPTSRGRWEGALFMHYLDHVFYIQFPFYNSTPTDVGRGWLFQLLMRDKSVYHAALALSQYHRRSILENVDLEEEYYMMALRGLQDTIMICKSQTWSGTSGLIHSIDALTCSLLLLFLEIFRGGAGAWQMHLRAAASLVPQIVKAYMLPSKGDSANSRAQCEWEELRVLAPEDHTAITILIGSFVWIDILAGASTGSRPFLDLDHHLLLQDSRIHLEELVGCENWVMDVILRISELRNWKKESESNHRLSISELAKRGAEIETCLQARLTKMFVQNTIQEDSFPVSRFSKFATATMTKIYALAALTYLHVTVSGPIFELPEITESVTRTIAELTSLSDSRLLRYLAWPFCITGCLASEEQQSVFRTLIQTGDFSERTVGTYMGAFKVMEECWRRRTQLRNCDWVSVMESLGHLILLV